MDTRINIKLASGIVYKGAILKPHRYESNGNLAIQAYDDDGEPIITATVNTPIKLDDDEVAVKDYSFNEGILQSLIDGDIVVPNSCGCIPSGFVMIPIHKLTEKGKDLFKGVES